MLSDVLEKSKEEDKKNCQVWVGVESCRRIGWKRTVEYRSDCKMQADLKLDAVDLYGNPREGFADCRSNSH